MRPADDPVPAGRSLRPRIPNDLVPAGAVVASWQTAVLFLGAALVGAVLTIAVLPAWLPGLRASLAGDEPKGSWYLSRASGLVAYGLAWLSMIFGLLITNKLARLWPRGPTAFAVHQHTSLLSLAFTAFHVLILLGDRYIDYTLADLLVPFLSARYRPLPIALGQIAFYMLAVVAFSSTITRT